MALQNQLQLSGKIASVPQVRYSPAGIGHTEFLFEHKSTQYEGALQRQAYCKIRTVVSGDLFTQFVQQLVEETSLHLTGFLNVRQSKSGAQDLIFYVQYIELNEESSENGKETSSDSALAQKVL